VLVEVTPELGRLGERPRRLEALKAAEAQTG